MHRDPAESLCRVEALLGVPAAIINEINAQTLAIERLMTRSAAVILLGTRQNEALSAHFQKLIDQRAKVPNLDAVAAQQARIIATFDGMAVVVLPMNGVIVL